jgi:hypothetical protein
LFGSDGVLQVTDKEVVEKFKHNTSRILTQDKINRAFTALSELETLTNTSELIERVTL